MPRNVWNDIISRRTKRLNNSFSINSMPSRPSFCRRRIEIRGRVVKSMLSNCSEIPVLGTSVNKLARSITKWTKAGDKRLSRLISYIHHTSEYKQYCHVGNTAKQCRLRLFQDSDFAGDLEDSKTTSGGTLCIFGSHAFVRISWMCKKQTNFSFAQFNRIRNHFLGCRIEDGRYTRT